MNPSLPSGMQEEADKMKGDAIGDTMYSERWVLKTLIKLSEKYMDYTSPDDYCLESELEGDLGLLWDMTIEPDVAKYLMDHNALDLIMDVLKFSGSPRLIEIMIGILGNLACEEGVRQKIGSNVGLIKIIINLLTFTDCQTLLQLVRLLTTCIWDMAKKTKKVIEDGGSGGDDVGDDPEGTTSHWIRCLEEERELVYRSINFILASSRNGELLTATLGLLESLFNLTWYSNDHFCKQFSTEECIKALIESLKEVTCHVEDVADSHSNYRRVRDACTHWITVVHRMTYHQLGTNALREHADTVFDLVGSMWVERSVSSINCSALHTTLAIEVLEALLPLMSHHCTITSSALALLEVPMEEWEGEKEAVLGLRRTLEDFCISSLGQWMSRGMEMVVAELSSLKAGPEGRLDLLEGLVVKRLSAAGTSSAPNEHFDLDTVLRTIKEVKVS